MRPDPIVAPSCALHPQHTASLHCRLQEQSMSVPKCDKLAMRVDVLEARRGGQKHNAALPATMTTPSEDSLDSDQHPT